MNNNNSIHNRNNIQAFKGIDGVNKMDEKEMTYQDHVYDIINKVATRSEREVPDYGDFAPVYEDFKNKNTDVPVGRYMLKVLKMPKADVADEKQRFIEASVYAPAGDYKAEMLLSGGHKDEILKELNSDKFPEKLNDAYLTLVDSIQNK